ncbi:MAG: cellulase family glycosylhydrolase [Fibrobacteraceae bacterium]
MEQKNNATDTKPGFFIQDRFLYTKDNEKVVLRGVNHMFIWTDREGKTIPEIAKTGANVVRIVWNMRGRICDLDHIISECIANNMIPMPELHDATGKWDRLPDLVNFWLRDETLQMIQDHQEYLIINIGNEVGAEEEDGEEFFRAYNAAVTQMRAAGIRVPLVIDADDWGKSTKNIFGQGKRLLQADPEHNLMFSLHMWWPSELHDPEKTGYATVNDRVHGELEKSVELGIPLIIGEFAPVAVNGAKEIPYQYIMAEAERLEIGWLAWSWGPGNFDSQDMDMTTHGSFNTLVEWGRIVCVDSSMSIQNTSIIPSFILNSDFTMGNSDRGRDLIANGKFDAQDPVSGWTSDFWGGKAEVKVENGQATFDILQAGADSWCLQFKQTISLHYGVTYIFSMRAKADKPRTLNVDIKRASEAYVPYANGRILDLSTSWQDFSWKFTMKEPSDDHAMLVFDMGGSKVNWTLADVSLVQARSVTERLNKSFQRNVQKNSGYFNAPGGPWELHLYSVTGNLLEVLAKGNGGEGMMPYPKIERSGILVIKDRT